MCHFFGGGVSIWHFALSPVMSLACEKSASVNRDKSLSQAYSGVPTPTSTTRGGSRCFLRCCLLCKFNVKYHVRAVLLVLVSPSSNVWKFNRRCLVLSVDQFGGCVRSCVAWSGAEKSPNYSCKRRCEFVTSVGYNDCCDTISKNNTVWKTSTNFGQCSSWWCVCFTVPCEVWASVQRPLLPI